jgi:aromatic ring hydroxylase-like protein
MRDGQGMPLGLYRNASLEILGSEYGDRIKYVSGRAKEQLALSTVLIRPDGFIAWASDNELDEQSIRPTVALWFGSCPPKEAL